MNRRVTLLLSLTAWFLNKRRHDATFGKHLGRSSYLAGTPTGAGVHPDAALFAKQGDPCVHVPKGRRSHLEHGLEDGDEHAGGALSKLLERVDRLGLNAHAVQQSIDARLANWSTTAVSVQQTLSTRR